MSKFYFDEEEDVSLWRLALFFIEAFAVVISIGTVAVMLSWFLVALIVR